MAMNNEKEEDILNELLIQFSAIKEQANSWIQKELEKEGFDHILPTHGSVFALLYKHHKPVTLTEIVTFTGKAKSTVTVMVQNLEKHGYLQRSASSSDRRTVYIELTERGKMLEGLMKRISKDLRHVLYGPMSDEEKESLAKLVIKLKVNLGLNDE